MTRRPRWCPRCREWRDWRYDRHGHALRAQRTCNECNYPTRPKPPAPKPPRRSRPARVRRTRKGGLTKACDVLFSKIIRARDGRCQDEAWRRNALGNLERHTCRGTLQCAHLISRRYRATRWHLNNAVALCAASHTYYTHHPLEWDDWCEQRLGKGRWEDLKQEAKWHANKLDLDKVLTTLRVEAERMGIK